MKLPPTVASLPPSPSNRRRASTAGWRADGGGDGQWERCSCRRGSWPCTPPAAYAFAPRRFARIFFFFRNWMLTEVKTTGRVLSRWCVYTHVNWGKIDATEEPRRAASDSQQCISKALSLLDEVSTSIPSATPFGRPAAVRRSKLQKSPNDGFLTRFPAHFMQDKQQKNNRQKTDEEFGNVYSSKLNAALHLLSYWHEHFLAKHSRFPYTKYYIMLMGC